MKTQKRHLEKFLKKHNLTAGNVEQTKQDATAQHLEKTCRKCNKIISQNSAYPNKDDRKYTT
jgi:hypothetical protein